MPIKPKRGYQAGEIPKILIAPSSTSFNIAVARAMVAAEMQSGLFTLECSPDVITKHHQLYDLKTNPSKYLGKTFIIDSLPSWFREEDPTEKVFSPEKGEKTGTISCSMSEQKKKIARSKRKKNGKHRAKHKHR